MLTALALGARELAGLPIPPSPTPISNFPSKTLPPMLHRKYITDTDSPAGPSQIVELTRSITGEAISKSRDTMADKTPRLIREKQLRVNRTLPSQSIVEVDRSTTRLGSHSRRPIMPPMQATSFKDLAAEFFVSPLVNRFWLHLGDSQARQHRSVAGRSSYSGAGAGMILSALVLGRLMETLTVLLHAARHSPAFLAVLAPEGLELAVNMGMRPVSAASSNKSTNEESSVLAPALELALVILNASIDLDGGRELGLEHTALVYSVGEWAQHVFQLSEAATGSEQGDDARVGKAAAGLLLEVERIKERWQRSMIAF
jgi:telomere length regulation protein